MKFAWDETKRRVNLAKHGLDFTDAPEVFNNPVLERLDTRCDYGEDRWIAVGISRNVLCIVLVYAVPNSKIIRIISFRKADKYESQAYFRTFTD